MEDTGRIRKGLQASARRIVFAGALTSGFKNEMEFITEVDRAHIVMLLDQHLIADDTGRRLLQEISRLRGLEYAPLRERDAGRGIYLCYESFLIETLGEEIGGMLHLARSRNDLNATVFRLKLREPFLKLVRKALRLQVVLLKRAGRFKDAVMPAYTHYQAAVPITYGHYLAGIAQALNRDIRGLMNGSDGLQRCPLGAGAAGGTSAPIDSDRTAELLGFQQAVIHSLDAVASRDLALRLLAAAAILATTLSRIAEDFLLWSSSEFGFLSFPDNLVGSSSMMPQKRNPFLLEHIQSRGTAALGAFVSAITATQGAPFTNSIRVSGESVSTIWTALEKVCEAAHLAALVVSGATPNLHTMRVRAQIGFTSATELATRLALGGAGCFRSVHHRVGEVITRAVEEHNGDLESIACREFANNLPAGLLPDLDPAAVARSCAYGGGAAPSSLQCCLEETHRELSVLRESYRAMERKWASSARELDRAVRAWCAAGITESPSETMTEAVTH